MASGRDWLAQRLGQPQPQGYSPAQPRQYVKPENRMPSNYQVSPDGLWVWNGQEWVPNNQQVPAPPPPPPVALPTQAALVSQHLGKAMCPRCGIDDTFMMMPNGKRRCFSCGNDELASKPFNTTAFDTSRGGTGGATQAARSQSGGSWAGEKNVQAPPQTREYT